MTKFIGKKIQTYYLKKIKKLKKNAQIILNIQNMQTSATQQALDGMFRSFISGT